MNISQDERERAIFRSRKKYQTDYDSDMATSKDNGRIEAGIEIAKKLLQRGRPTEEIMEDIGLAREEVENLRN